jgi:hypothetical protein
MNPSPLPRYLRPEPPTALVAGMAGRGWLLLLQFVTIVAFWVGIYVIREKARAFSEAYRRAEERAKVEDAKKAIMGLWQSTQEKSVQLELRHGRYSLLRDGSVSRDGEYEWSGDGLKLYSTRSPMRINLYWSLRCRLEGDELVLWDDGARWNQDGDWFLMLNVLGCDAAPRAYAEENVLRFRRVGR